MKVTLAQMAPGASLFDVAEVELGLGVDLATGMVSSYVTLFDAGGEILGGVRPIETPGFFIQPPVQAPQAVLDNLASGATHIGVTSNDFQTLESYEATWDYLNVTSPQIPVSNEGPDAFNGTVFGDFSEDGLVPTDIGVLQDGDNSLVAQQAGDNGPEGRDRDYFTFEVPVGKVLTEIVLAGFDNGDPTDTAGFIGIVAGNQITTDPTGTDPGNLDGGFIFGSGELGEDILDDLGAGTDQQGTGFPGFELPLPAGVYTIWLNQGADLPATVTLNLKTADATATLSISDAPSVVEAGDIGTTELVFGLTLDDAGFNGELDVGFDTDTVSGQSQAVSFVNGAGTLAVLVANDDTDDGDDMVAVTLTSVSGGGQTVVLGTATANGTVTEDDSVSDPSAVVTTAGDPVVVESGDAATTTALAFGLAYTGADATRTIEFSIDGGATQSAQVSFVNGAGTLTVELANDDLADGDDTVALALISIDGDAALGDTTTATATVTEDDFVTTVDQGIALQTTDEDALFSFAVPGDAFADADSAALTMTATLADDSPLPAWLTFDGTGFSGTPLQADIGTIRIKVSAGDGANPVVSIEFDLIVDNVNDAPTVLPIDAGTVTETDTFQQIDLLSTAADEDGDAVVLSTILSVVDSAGADVAYTDNGDGTVSIDPQQFAGTLSDTDTTTVTITYEVSDQIAPAVQNTATLVVSGDNAPRYWYIDADADGFGSSDENDPVLYQNDQPDGYVDNDLDWNDADPTVHPGATEINDGKDNDQDGLVDEDNTAPEPVDDSFSVTKDQPLVLQASDLLGNDADDDGDTAFTILGVTSGNGGQASYDANSGVVSFTPQTGFVGTASFTYQMADGFGGTASGTVTVEVTGETGGTTEIPIPITTSAMSGYANQDKSPAGYEFVEGGNDITLTGNTWKSITLPQPLTVTAGMELVFTVASDQLGEIIGIGFETDQIWRNGGQALFQLGGTDTVAGIFDQTYNSYEEDGGAVEFRIDLSDHVGTTFNYLVVANDKDAGPETNTVTFSDIRVVPTAPAGNAPPVAVDDAFDMGSEASIVIDKSALLANDTDTDGDTLSVGNIFNVTGGAVTQTADQITFTAADGFTGEASFDYAVNDGNGGTAVATVRIDVEAAGGGNETVLPIDFNQNPIESYSGGQDKTPDAFEIDADGSGITLSGNIWKKTVLPGGTFTIDADTVLRFDVTMETGSAEFVSIGLENDDDYRTDDDLLFQVFGPVTLSKFDQSVHGKYTTVGQTVSYEISLAEHAGRTFEVLALINDDDATQSSVVRFSNVELVKAGIAPPVGEPPYIVNGTLPDVGATEDVPIEISLPFLDPDTPYDQLAFTFSGLPEFLTLTDGVLSGTPDNEDVGLHTIEVTATDPEGNATVGDFDLTVENVNDAPVLNGSIADTTAALNNSFTLALPTGLFTDVDAGDTISYSAEGLPSGLEIDPVTGEISGTPDTVGSFAVTVTATDLALAEVSTSFVLQVGQQVSTDPITIEMEEFTGLTETNSDLLNFREDFAAPASGNQVVRVSNSQSGVISTSLSNFGVTAGLYELELYFFDEDDGESSVELFLQIPGGPLESIGSFTMDQVLPGQGNATQAANLTSITLNGVNVPEGARLVISGTADNREVLRLDKVVLTPEQNAAPSFESPAAQQVAENATIAGDVDAVDPEGSTVSYAIVGGADQGLMTIDPASGVLSFVTPADFEVPGDANGDNVYEVTVSASDGATLATQDVTVTVLDTDGELSFTSPSAAQAAENQTVVTTVVATEDGGAGTITYAIGTSGVDGGLFAIDATTGALSFLAAPDFEVPGDSDGDSVYEVEVVASNGTAEASQTVSVTVTDANDAPDPIEPAPSQVANTNAASTFTATDFFTDQDGDAMTLVSATGLPSGLSLVNGEVTGTPTQAGSYQVTIEATDGVETVSTMFDLVVEGEVGPFGPVAPGQDLDGDLTPNVSDPDVDGDTVPNAADHFAYDANNGVLLGENDVIDLTFDVDGTPYQNGFTGLLQAAQGANNTLKDFNEETGAASVANGLLSVATTTGDTGGSNTPQDDYQLGIKNAEFTVEARVLNPFTGQAPVSFDQIGIHVGVDSTDFAKLVIGNTIEFSKRSDDAETKAGGGNQPLPGGLGTGEWASVDIRLVVNSTDANSASISAFATFLGATGNPLAGATNVNIGTLQIDGALAAALADETAAVGTGFTHVHAGSSTSFTAQLDSFKVTPGADPEPGDPTSALEAFETQTDLDTSQSYSTGTVGSAVLEIMAGNNNIEGSNFGQNSFQVTNTGGKKISAVFIDVSQALYPDSVFDPDGAGGDSASKAWAINTGGNTGGYIGGGVGGYFLPGPDPLPNTTGTGSSSNGGYKGAMVKFDPTTSNGFQTGETVGFSGDMDPNSIAGLTKSSVDNLAIDSWDVGGISGHELIGSNFTVLFDDGTTASGQLGSDGSASGSHAIATQDAAIGAAAPTLTVNGVGAGGLGTYGVTLPSVIVSGTPGDTIQVTLTKGFNPVVGTGNEIAQLVEDRLDAYDFKANNTFDNQHITVTLDSSGTADISDQFDYDDSPANNKEDGTFPGDDVAQIGFVAAVVDPSNGNLPISPITSPIYLTNDGGPVVSDPNTAPEGYFQIVNSGGNGYFKIQIEDENGTGGTNPGGKWSYQTAADPEGRQSGFQGDGYYLFGSNSSTAIDNNINGDDLLEYTIFVPDTDLGTYTVAFGVSRDGVAEGDQQNDLWLNLKPAEQAGNGDIHAFMPPDTEPEPHQKGFVKLYGGSNNGNWSETSKVDGLPNFTAQVTFDNAGLYTVQVEGRSEGYHVDYFELYQGGTSPSAGAADSQFIEGDPDTGGGGGGGGGGGTIGTITTPVDASSDDWEQFGGANSKDLEFGLNGSNPQAVGIRFDGIDIPDTANIVDAYLQFTARETSSGAASFTIGIEGTENAATFSSAAPPQTRGIVDEFNWSNVEQWSAGTIYRTPDISELIETVIGNDGVSNGAFAFVIEGSGSRVASSFNDNIAPELVLVLEDGTTQFL